MKRYSVLLVCTDNLCRSPTAEVVLRQQAAQHGLAELLHVESAATHDFNVGEPVDIRVQKHAIRRDYDLSSLRARLVTTQDFERFDLILVMEQSNELVLRMRCPQRHHHKIRFFTEFCSGQVARDLPDPFFGKSADFEQVLDQVEDAVEGLIGHLTLACRALSDPPR